MKKKWFQYFLLLFLAYALLVYFYLFHWSDTALPKALQGTAVDPATFMSNGQLADSIRYSQIRNWLFFILTPLEWLFYFAILYFGISKALARWSKRKPRFLQAFFYMLGLSFLSFIVFLPIKFFSYRLADLYGISTQTVPAWFQDVLISFAIDFAFTLLAVTTYFWLVRRFQEKWWIWAWLITIPFTLFVMYIQPVVIDPLYHDFYPLKDKALEKKILTLAHQANIPADHVFEVNMSQETNSLNAYVTGIGGNARIVLWDTTLQKLTDDEILFVMAHEMGHYVELDVYQGIALYLASSFFGLWLIHWLVSRYTRKQDNLLQVQSMQELHVIPLMLLLISVLSFLFSPVENTFSRMQEARADQYAIVMTDNAKAGVTSFQKLSAYGLTQMNPPLLVKIFRYSHPTMVERIQTLEKKQ